MSGLMRGFSERYSASLTVSLIILIIMVLLAVFAPLLTTFSPDSQNLALGSVPPSLTHWLGTDELGRDVFARVLYGSRISLSVGLLATLVALVIGVTWGAIAGYVGGRVDALMMRFVDGFYALPFVMLIILLTVIFGQQLILIFLVIGAVEWLTMARVVRAQVLSLKYREFVLAATAMGGTGPYIIRRHILPNLAGVIVVYATLTIPSVILLESFLSFLGLGIQPPNTSWGSLIAQGVGVMEEYPWLLIAPSAMLILTLFALNSLGDSLLRRISPR